ncbi:E3 ubiquitin-protein ligase PUB23-like [Malania oleifera]|uniref:E3 ubiquitin-protein ligase PUB23-like n=1 Tax=Malania oleifera TaxID=397392 RepID=UPI0025AEA811|nr:E3 ubiquitin-protein ligase PUB23-like [Malania oleifera]
MDSSSVEIPEYFVCPISLQIMKDPVTTVTGITYDRKSIELWLFTCDTTTCPVTKQRLPPDSDLTPNHTLRRLIQAWCMENASNGVDQIPTPQAPLRKSHLLKILQDLQNPKLQLKTLKRLELLATDNQSNRKYMAEAGVANTMASIIVNCHKKGQISGLDEALRVLHLVLTNSPAERAVLLDPNDQIIDSLSWALGLEIYKDVAAKGHAVLILKALMETASANILERLKLEFYDRILGVLGNERLGSQKRIINTALQVLLDACPRGRNRMVMVEAGAVFRLIELELGMPEKRTSELIFGILFHLCSCADGRAQLLSHRGGIAMVSRRIMRVSATVDDRGISILLLICKFAGTRAVLREMLVVGGVAKLCMVMEADCAAYLKDRVLEILALHSSAWRDSPCFSRCLQDPMDISSAPTSDNASDGEEDTTEEEEEGDDEGTREDEEDAANDDDNVVDD